MMGEALARKRSPSLQLGALTTLWAQLFQHRGDHPAAPAYAWAVRALGMACTYLGRETPGVDTVSQHT